MKMLAFPGMPPPLSMGSIKAHPEVRLTNPLVLVCYSVERIGSTQAHGGGDMIVLRDPDGSTLMLACLAWIQFTDSHVPDGEKVAVIYARCAQGEYRVKTFGAANAELRESPELYLGMPSAEQITANEERNKAHYLGIYAALWQRQQQPRSTALDVPVPAGALASMSTAGRVKATRADALSERRLEVNTTREPGRGAIRERVTVELVMPKTRGQRVKLKAGEEVFPQFKARERRELPALVTEELAHRLRPRSMQAVLASIAVAYQEDGILLDDDGALPARFRTKVMRVMGMPSTTASKAQRDLVRDAMELVRDAEFHVKPASGDKRATYFPLLVVQEFIDPPAGAERRPARLAPNDALMGSMADGRRLRIPEALFQIDEDDRDGVRTLAGLQLAHRLAMGTCNTHEKAELFLRRAGLWEWCRRKVTERGMPHVLAVLRHEFDALRSLSWRDHSPVDIAGRTAIEGEDIRNAVVVYRDPPSWACSSS